MLPRLTISTLRYYLYHPSLHPPHLGRVSGGRVSAESHPHQSTCMREQYYASYAKALYSCSPLSVPCGTHFIRLYEAQPRSGAELVFGL